MVGYIRGMISIIGIWAGMVMLPVTVPTTSMAMSFAAVFVGGIAAGLQVQIVSWSPIKEETHAAQSADHGRVEIQS